MDDCYAGVTRPLKKHQVKNRTFQGIPGLAVTRSGRIFTVCYTGGKGEGADNYVTLWISDDQGKNWSDPLAVVDPPETDVRAFDPALWIAPDGRLCLFWAQAYALPAGRISDGRNGVWFSVLEQPDAPVEEWVWSRAVRIADGVMMNPPIVCRDGTWLLPVSVWENADPCSPVHPENSGVKCVASEDNGKTFCERGCFHLPAAWRIFDEHTFVEHPDGQILCVARTLFGNAEAWSSDGGRSWSEPERSRIPGPNSRLMIQRLKSGRLLLVNNDVSGLTEEEKKADWRPRRKMTAWLSDDEGKNWYGGLVLDGRDEVSYPAGQQAEDGSIWIVHDHLRYKGGEILVSHVTEADVAAGKLISPESRLLILACHSAPVKK